MSFSKLTEETFGLHLEGSEAIAFAQRMFSKNLLSLQDGGASPCCFLSADGKLNHFFWLIRKNDHELLLIGTGETSARLTSDIETYQFSDHFELKELPYQAYWREIETNTPEIPECSWVLEKEELHVKWKNTEFLFSLSSLDEGSNESWEYHRVKNLIPSILTEKMNQHLVFEFGFENFCDSNKGCYIGQEVVERVKTRNGQAAQKLCTFESTQKPTEGSAIVSEQNLKLGEITSVSPHPSRSKHFYALGFLKRKAIETNEKLFLEENKTPLKVVKTS